jgi:hypothetical protein
LFHWAGLDEPQLESLCALSYQAKKEKKKKEKEEKEQKKKKEKEEKEKDPKYIEEKLEKIEKKLQKLLEKKAKFEGVGHPLSCHGSLADWRCAYLLTLLRLSFASTYGFAFPWFPIGTRILKSHCSCGNELQPSLKERPHPCVCWHANSLLFIHLVVEVKVEVEMTRD